MWTNTKKKTEENLKFKFNYFPILPDFKSITFYPVHRIHGQAT